MVLTPSAGIDFPTAPPAADATIGDERPGMRLFALLDVSTRRELDILWVPPTFPAPTFSRAAGRPGGARAVALARITEIAEHAAAAHFDGPLEDSSRLTVRPTRPDGMPRDAGGIAAATELPKGPRATDRSGTTRTAPHSTDTSGPFRRRRPADR
ncbi:hypothetical protein [Embleya sp. NBC_00896]|uniref:hypothetical protein n=1 Tax=Embleya sp. NBC_00896 TaxID=2975961 RepID=UPI00386A6FFD|nr:hypothetical protein OG928_48300 [Embleya sp. NBC_00896]